MITMLDALRFTALGLGIVFTVLALLMVFISVMRRLDDRWQAAEKAARDAALERPQTIDDTTLVLIAAAVATMVTGRGRIRSIRRIIPSDAPTSAWSQQGRASLQGSHVIIRKQGNHS